MPSRGCSKRCSSASSISRHPRRHSRWHDLRLCRLTASANRPKGASARPDSRLLQAGFTVTELVALVRKRIDGSPAGNGPIVPVREADEQGDDDLGQCTDVSDALQHHRRDPTRSSSRLHRLSGASCPYRPPPALEVDKALAADRLRMRLNNSATLRQVVRRAVAQSRLAGAGADDVVAALRRAVQEHPELNTLDRSAGAGCGARNARSAGPRWLRPHRACARSPVARPVSGSTFAVLRGSRTAHCPLGKFPQPTVADASGKIFDYVRWE